MDKTLELNRLVDLLRQLRVASIVMKGLPEQPGYNGSRLTIDDDEAERIAATIGDAAETIARFESARKSWFDLNDQLIERHDEIERQLAFSQADNERLRSFLKQADSCLCALGSGEGGWAWEEVHDENHEVLAQPTDTSALDAYIAERTKELQAKIPAWQKIETAPRDGTRIILLVEPPCFVTTGKFCASVKRFDGSPVFIGGPYDNSTHVAHGWMPLPPSPKQEVKL